MKNEKIKLNEWHQFSKTINESDENITEIKNILMDALNKYSSMLIRDVGDNKISIATGDKYSVLVQILGYDKEE